MLDLLNLYPALMKTILIALILLIVYNLNNITKPFKKIKTRTWIILFLIFLCGLAIRLFFVPHTHQVYSDEFIDLNAAENILYSNKLCWCFAGSNQVCEICQLVPWPPGYHTVLSLLLGVFGDSEAVAFNTNAVLGSLSIILMFLLIFLIFNDSTLALVGSFMFSLVPVLLKFSGTTSLEIFSLFSVILAMICLEIYLRTKKISTFALFLAALLYAMNSRPENFLLLIPFSLYILLKEGKGIKKMFKLEYMVLLVIFIAASVPLIELLHWDTMNIVHSYSESLSARVTNLQEYLIPNILFLFTNSYSNSLVFSCLCIIGAVELFLHDTKRFIYYSSFFFVFIFLFSTISNGAMYINSNAASPVRFSIVLYAPLTLFLVAGTNSILRNLPFNKNILTILLISLYLLSLTTTQNFIFLKNKFSGEYEFILSMQTRIPSDVYVLSFDPPSVISTIHRSSIAPDIFTENWSSIEPKNNVILFEDPGWYIFGSGEEPEKMLVEHYNFKLIAESPEGYAFYNLTLKQVSN